MSIYLKTLKKHWGYDALKPLQEKAVQTIEAGKDVVVLLPTGGGKSLCFQLPATIMPGLAVVVSPLISLMQDQVAQLTQRGIKAMHLSGNHNMRQLDVMLGNAAFGGYKLLYLSPERLQTDWILSRLQTMNVSFIAVDEAHCISQWGYDFRPSYLNIGKLREALPNLPVMALTASATPQVLADIRKEMRLRDPVLVRDSFFRTNLSIQIIDTERKEARCLAIMQQTVGSAIVYLRSRKGTLALAKFFNEQGITAAYYHAGMDPAERQKVQQSWMQNKTRLIVATTAFGMGIDKGDVRYVFHLDLPDSPESYYQEIGRAGRDNQLAHCYLLYNQADVMRLAESWKDEPDIYQIRKIYAAFCSENQIATGAGQYSERPIHIFSFANKYNFSSRHVHQAFTLLDRGQYVVYEDVSNRPSALVFNTSAQDLYTFQIQNPSLEPVTKALLRLYGGITEQSMPISEDLLSRKTGLPIPQVIKHLEILAKRGKAHYKKNYKGTTVLLLTERLPDKSITIAPELLQMRVRNKQMRADAMIALIANTEVCRMAQIVKYFGEKAKINCGICDACLQQSDLFVQQSILKIVLKGDIQLSDLPELLPQIAKDKLQRAVESLVDAQKVRASPNGILKRHQA